MSAPLNTYTIPLTREQAATLRVYLRDHDFVFGDVPYADFAGAKGQVNVVFYPKRGKVVIQGKGTQEFIEFILEPLILKQAKLGYEEVLNPDLLAPRIGVDESGKGDFFGPLCIAGVYVNESVVKAWKTAGVRDSKAISSDKKIGELTELIQKTEGCIWTVIPIGNESYNRLMVKFKSVNRLLAWGHARAIENLMVKRDLMNPPPVRAISDQFASDKATVAKALMALGREIELVQRHRAEEDLAVAAASILARNEFVTRLQRLGKEYGIKFPKGAGKEVDVIAKQFFEKHGAAELGKVAKMHFRTSLRAQGLPEPERVEWRKPSSRNENLGDHSGAE
jgi:ribonuclease HIII